MTFTTTRWSPPAGWVRIVLKLVIFRAGKPAAGKQGAGPRGLPAANGRRGSRRFITVSGNISRAVRPVSYAKSIRQVLTAHCENSLISAQKNQGRTTIELNRFRCSVHAPRRTDR